MYIYIYLKKLGFFAEPREGYKGAKFILECAFCFLSPSTSCKAFQMTVSTKAVSFNKWTKITATNVLNIDFLMEDTVSNVS